MNMIKQRKQLRKQLIPLFYDVEEIILLLSRGYLARLSTFAPSKSITLIAAFIIPVVLRA